MASRDVFIDTSGLYALIDRRDAHHPAVRGVVEQTLHAGRRFVVSDYIVAESVNLANARSGSRVACGVLDLLDKSVAIRVEWIGDHRFEATRRYFRKHADHRHSFTDCSSFVLMAELGLKQALTTDRHFIEAGFQALLAPS